MSVDNLPLVNAVLNTISAVLLMTGYVLIKQGKREAHKRVMIAACVTSAAFLACYLTYHYHARHVVFPGEGTWRTIYLVILVTHVILAIVNLPMIITTLWRAYKGDFERHRKIARWTFPIWFYVSVTGVVVYLMVHVIQW